MSRKERDYEIILKGLREIEETMRNLNSNAKRLGVEANAAEGELKDRVGKKDIQMIKDLSETISKATAPGEERILELIRKVERDKQAFEELDR